MVQDRRDKVYGWQDSRFTRGADTYWRTMARLRWVRFPCGCDRCRLGLDCERGCGCIRHLGDVPCPHHAVSSLASEWLQLSHQWHHRRLDCGWSTIRPGDITRTCTAHTRTMSICSHGAQGLVVGFTASSSTDNPSLSCQHHQHGSSSHPSNPTLGHVGCHHGQLTPTRVAYTAPPVRACMGVNFERLIVALWCVVTVSCDCEV